MTTTTACVEVGFAGLVAALVAALPDVPVERNRRDPVDYDAGEAPRLILRDGAQIPVEGGDTGSTLYTVAAQVEGYVEAATDAALGAALNALYLRVCGALFGRELVLAGGLEIWPVEGRLERDFAAAVESAKPSAAFFLQLSFDVLAPIGAPSVTY